MNGPEHYAEAERLLQAYEAVMENPLTPGAMDKAGPSGAVVLGHMLAQAQVHATLALAAATALSALSPGDDMSYSANGERRRAWGDLA